MDFIRRKMKKLRMKKSATKISQGDKVVSLHRVKISERDMYQQSACPSQRTIKRRLVTEFKDYKSQELNDVVLEIMGTENSTASIFGRPIHNELAIRFEDIATTGLSNGQRKDLLQAYLPPVNCKLIGAPALNPEVKKAVSDLDIKQDKIIRNKQKQISSAIACLGEALSLLLSKDTNDPTVSRLITDCARILCDSQYNDSLTRRNYILSTLKGDLKKQLANTKINGMLFGTALAQSLKTAELKKNSKNNLKVQISTVLHKIGTPSAKAPNSNPISKVQIIHDSHDNKKVQEIHDHKIHDPNNHKIHDSHEQRKIQDTHDRKIHDPHIHNFHDSHNQKVKSSNYRNSKKQIKDFIMVPLEKDTIRSPRSSKQMNRRDSRQREKSPTQSKASTSSSHRRR